MSVPNFDNPNAGLYWGVVEGAARQGLGTAAIWDAIREHAAALGLESPGVTAQDVSRLRGQAGGIIRAENALGRAPAQQGIGAEMIATPWFGRTLDRQNAMPVYQARFEHTVLRDGVEVTEWRTVTFRGALPATVGALADAVDLDAAQMADNYGVEHLGVGTISLMAV